MNFKFKKNLLISSVMICGVLFYNNCSQSGFSIVPTSNPSNSPSGGGSTISANWSVPTGPNVVQVNLGGFGNEGYITVTICVPNSTTCYTVPNIQIDSGSTGLRIFSSALPSGAANQFPATGQAECYAYLSAPSDWGPVKMATVQISGETTSSAIPIMMIDNTYGDQGQTCLNANSGTSLDAPASYYNGIIGVNFLVHDCGNDCTSVASESGVNPTYYSCSGSSCTLAAAALSQQLVNPVAYFPVDNNGIIFQFPPITGNSSGATGYAIMGIGTQSNNTPSSGLSVLPIDDQNVTDPCYTEVPANQGGSNTCAFLDTGSNSYYFASPTIAYSSQSGDYDPASPATVSATLMGYNSSVSVAIQFSVANVESALQDGTLSIFPQWGSEEGTTINTTNALDLGLPFFLGRRVYVGFEGASSSLGSGSYWAF